jgi:hypothetical protein
LEIRLNFILNFLSRISSSGKLAKTGSSKGGFVRLGQYRKPIPATRFSPEIIFPFFGLWQFTSSLANATNRRRKAHGSPAGTTDNSPPFQRRVPVIKTNQVPQGRKKTHFHQCPFCRPCGACSILAGNPRLKPRAIFLQPLRGCYCANVKGVCHNLGLAALVPPKRNYFAAEV